MINFQIYTAQRQETASHRVQESSQCLEEEDLELPLFDLATISTATNNFSFENKIGEGGFGPVYKVMFDAYIVRKTNLIVIEYLFCCQTH